MHNSERQAAWTARFPKEKRAIFTSAHEIKLLELETASVAGHLLMHNCKHSQSSRNDGGLWTQLFCLKLQSQVTEESEVNLASAAASSDSGHLTRMMSQRPPEKQEDQLVLLRK